jgi:RsiW-degrading membrane proteinase PrsW (M82 family)
VQFVLHKESALGVFALGAWERKVVRALEGLPRTLEDLCERARQPPADVESFVAFLLLTRSLFRLGDDAPDEPPVGNLTVEERIEREPPEQAPNRSAALGYVAAGLLGGSFLPLFFSLLSEPDLTERIHRTVRAHPELAPLPEGATLDELLHAVPEHKLAGALLTQQSQLHWLLGAASLIVFASLIFTVPYRGRAKRGEILKAAAVTATAGVAFLFVIQILGEALQGVYVRGANYAVVAIYVVQFIGVSYRAAANPGSDFFLSFLGFTCGVGFCEELVKALPVLGHFRAKGTLDVYGAIVLGLASGAGLGASEGVLYSATFYNGVDGPLMYLVRFVSCVSLHAVWSAMVAVAIYRKRAHFTGRANFIDRAWILLTAMWLPMVLHALYDTLLKKDMRVGALAVAGVSLLLFFHRYRKASSDQGGQES